MFVSLVVSTHFKVGLHKDCIMFFVSA